MTQTSVSVDKHIDGTALKPIYINDSGEVILCGQIHCTQPITTGDIIKLAYDYTERGIGIHIEEKTDTSLFDKDKSSDDIVYVLARVRDNRCIADYIYPDIFSASLDRFKEASNKHQVLEWFSSLPQQQKESILIQIRSELYDATHDITGIRTSGVRNLLNKYYLTKATYTPQQQADIEEMFSCFRDHSASNTKKQKTENRLQYLLNINTSSKYVCQLKKSEIIEALNKELYKLDAVKETVAEAIVASKYSKVKGLIIALVGNPGVGKTAIAKAIAKVLGIPFDRISLGSASTLLDMTGLCYTFDGSDAGEPVRIFYKHGTTHMVMLLDEFDKASDSKEGNPQNAFNDMLSDDRFIKDAYLSTYVRTPDTITILTMNSTESVPEHLLNRCMVIHVDDYENDEKLEIVKKFIFPSALARYHISQELMHFPDESILYLLNSFCEDAGARDAKRFTEKIVCNVLADWDEKGEQNPIRITPKMIEKILGNVVDRDSDVNRYIRNKHLYSAEVRREIQDLLGKLKRTDVLGDDRQKAQTRLHYLVSLIPVGDAFTGFDADAFYAEMNETHYGMQKVKDEIAKVFYCKSIQKQSLSSVRILFEGEPGIGKSSIIQTIAKALHAQCRRIALNGVADENALKGFPSTYIGADAGKFVRAAADMKTTRGILHLDEVDKLGRREGKDIADTLVDVLDNSALLTDNFLGVPVDFSEMMFIATANDLSNVPQVILDRFIVIHVDGYTKEEKAQIAEDYILPKLEKAYCPDGVTLQLVDDTLDLLLDRYCTSSGVRDIEKALERIVRHKLYITRNQERTVLSLTEENAVSVLGEVDTTTLGIAFRKIGFY